MAQSWVMNTQARSIGSEAMATAVDNKRRIMSSSLFGDDAPRYQPTSYETTQQPRTINRPTAETYAEQPSNQINVTIPTYSNSSQPMNQIPDFVPMAYTQPPEIITSFRSRTQPRNYCGRRLDVLPNDEMQKIRDSLITDTTNISKRLRQIGQN